MNIINTELPVSVSPSIAAVSLSNMSTANELQEILEKGPIERTNIEKQKLVSFFRETHFLRKLFKKSHIDRVSRVLESCANKAHFRFVRPGDQVFRYSDKADTIYFVISGQAVILVPKKYQQIQDEQRNRAHQQKNQSNEMRRTMSPIRMKPSQGFSEFRLSAQQHQDLPDDQPNQSLLKLRRATSKLKLFGPMKERNESPVVSPQASPLLQRLQSTKSIASPEKKEIPVIQRRDSISLKRLQSSPRKTVIYQASPFSLVDIAEDGGDGLNKSSSSASKVAQISPIKQEEREEEGKSSENKSGRTYMSLSTFSPLLLKESKVEQQFNYRWIMEDEEFQSCFPGISADEVNCPIQYFEGEVFKYSLGSVLNEFSNTPTTDLIQSQARTTTCVALAPLFLAGIDRMDYTKILKESEEERLNRKVSRICSSFSGEQIPNLKKIMTDLVPFLEKRSFQLGEYVFSENEPVQGCFIVKSGEIELTKFLEQPQFSSSENSQKDDALLNLMQQTKFCTVKEVTLSILGVGQFFGEEEMLQKRKKRYINAKCKSASAQIYFVHRQHFVRVLYDSLPVLEVFQCRAKAKDDWHENEFERLRGVILKDPKDQQQAKLQLGLFPKEKHGKAKSSKKNGIFQDAYDKMELSQSMLDNLSATAKMKNTSKISKPNFDDFDSAYTKSSFNFQEILKQKGFGETTARKTFYVTTGCENTVDLDSGINSSEKVQDPAQESTQQGFIENSSQMEPLLKNERGEDGNKYPQNFTTENRRNLQGPTKYSPKELPIQAVIPIETTGRSHSCTTLTCQYQKPKVSSSEPPKCYINLNRNRSISEKSQQLTLIEDNLKLEVWAQMQAKRDIQKKIKAQVAPSKQAQTYEEKQAILQKRNRIISEVSNANYERIFKQAKQSVWSIHADKIQASIDYTPTFFLQSLAPIQYPQIKRTVDNKSNGRRFRSMTHDTVYPTEETENFQRYQDVELSRKISSRILEQRRVSKQEIYESQSIEVKDSKDNLNKDQIQHSLAEQDRNISRQNTAPIPQIPPNLQRINSKGLIRPSTHPTKSPPKSESSTQTPFTRTMQTIVNKNVSPQNTVFQPLSNTSDSKSQIIAKIPSRQPSNQSSRDSTRSNNFHPTALPRRFISQNQKRSTNSLEQDKQTTTTTQQPYFDIKNSDLSLEHLIKIRCSQNMIMKKKHLSQAKQSVFDKQSVGVLQNGPLVSEAAPFLNSSLLDHLKGAGSNKKNSTSFLYANHLGKPIKFKINK